MTGSFKRTILVCYLLLAVYLLGSSVPEGVITHADELDHCVAKMQIAGGAPALANALGMEPASVLSQLQRQRTKPSTLAMAKFVSKKTSTPFDVILSQHSFQQRPIDYISNSGINLEEVTSFLKRVKKSVEAQQAPKQLTQNTAR